MLQVQTNILGAKSRKEMTRDLKKTRNEKRVFFTIPQRKDSGQEATGYQHPGSVAGYQEREQMCLPYFHHDLV